MAQSPETVSAAAEQTSFELEPFELTGEDRLELRGRWFGLRGRRFVRPTLTLFGDGEKSRSLADLEHKPWSAEEGESWTAAFPCDLDGGEVLEVELAVAPGIAVTPWPTGTRPWPTGTRPWPCASGLWASASRRPVSGTRLCGSENACWRSEARRCLLATPPSPG